MGLLEDSFIHITKQAEVLRQDIVRKIGYCSLIDEIENMLDELEDKD